MRRLVLPAAFGVLCLLAAPATRACTFDPSLMDPSLAGLNRATVERQARAGSANAQYLMGYAVASGAWLVNGKGGDGCDWYARAARAGHVKAEFEYAGCTGDSWSKRREDRHYFLWLKRSADGGYDAAQCAMGDLYDNPYLPSHDDAKAVVYFKLAAANGRADAQKSLADHYFEGRGVARNKAEAARLYRKAADQGEAMAAYALADMYVLGDGVSADRMEAAKLFMQARDLMYGREVSPSRIAWKYYRDDGSYVDIVAYYGWLSQVEEFEGIYNPPPYFSDVGTPTTLPTVQDEARREMTAIEKAMSPEILAEAKAFAARLRPLLLAHEETVQMEVKAYCEPELGCTL